MHSTDRIYYLRNVIKHLISSCSSSNNDYSIQLKKLTILTTILTAEYKNKKVTNRKGFYLNAGWGLHPHISSILLQQARYRFVRSSKSLNICVLKINLNFKTSAAVLAGLACSPVSLRGNKAAICTGLVHGRKIVLFSVHLWYEGRVRFGSRSWSVSVCFDLRRENTLKRTLRANNIG